MATRRIVLLVESSDEPEEMTQRLQHWIKQAGETLEEDYSIRVTQSSIQEPSFPVTDHSGQVHRGLSGHRD